MQMAPLKRVELDPQQKRQWQDTLGACSWIAPGFVHIIYTMMCNTDESAEVALFTEDIQTAAATDGFQLIFKPTQFFMLELLERVFAVLHEVCHEMWNHCRAVYVFRKKGEITVAGKGTLPWDDEYSNFMQDFIINDTLINAKFGKFNKAWLHNPAIANQMDDWVTAYFRNWKQRMTLPIPQGGQGKPCDDGQGGLTRMPAKGRFDQHLDPHRSQGKDPASAPERKQAQWDVAIKVAMEIQRAQGKLPASMEMFFKQLLEPKVSWEDHIEGEFQRLLGQGAYDWRRLDRRLIVRGIGAPGTTGKGARLIGVGGDTSMSVFANRKLVARWLAELGGMIENVNPEEIHVVWCDTEIKRIDVLQDAQDIQNCMFKGVPGGGGTDFRAVFKHFDEGDVVPDVLVYLTDGEGRFPDRAPDYPVIWGDISGGSSRYPFGKVVSIPVGEDANDD